MSVQHCPTWSHPHCSARPPTSGVQPFGAILWMLAQWTGRFPAGLPTKSRICLKSGLVAISSNYASPTLNPRKPYLDSITIHPPLRRHWNCKKNVNKVRIVPRQMPQRVVSTAQGPLQLGLSIVHPRTELRRNQIRHRGDDSRKPSPLPHSGPFDWTTSFQLCNLGSQTNQLGLGVAAQTTEWTLLLQFQLFETLLGLDDCIETFVPISSLPLR